MKRSQRCRKKKRTGQRQQERCKAFRSNRVIGTLPVDARVIPYSYCSSNRVVSDEYKLNIYVRIVRLLLEDDDATSAESYFNRASLLVHSTSDRETQLHFKLSQARILDSKRRFADAALRYHELSYFTELAEDDRLACLGAAVTCAVLAPAGPNRSRILGTLYRDERSASLPDYTILSKMFLDQIIRPGELKEFESRLRPHQLAKLPPTSIVLAENDDDEAPLEGLARGKKGPETVLDRAVMQHNLLAASRIYNNITFRGLGALLSLTPTAAEAMARTMIQEKRLRGTIDQVEGLITFEARKRGDEGVVSNVAAAGEKDGEADSNVAPATARWDDAVRFPSSINLSAATDEDYGVPDPRNVAEGGGDLGARRQAPRGLCMNRSSFPCSFFCTLASLYCIQHRPDLPWSTTSYTLPSHPNPSRPAHRLYRSA